MTQPTYRLQQNPDSLAIIEENTQNICLILDHKGLNNIMNPPITPTTKQRIYLHFAPHLETTNATRTDDFYYYVNFPADRANSSSITNTGVLPPLIKNATFNFLYTFPGEAAISTCAHMSALVDFKGINPTSGNGSFLVFDLYGVTGTTYDNERLASADLVSLTTELSDYVNFPSDIRVQLRLERQSTNVLDTLPIGINVGAIWIEYEV